jgi:hypothetical protein
MKLTPPAPQNATRRLKFFLENPDWPKAKYWTIRLREELSHKKFGFTKRVAMDAEILIGRLEPRIPGASRPDIKPHHEKKKPFIQHFINKFKKASQRGV